MPNSSFHIDVIPFHIHIFQFQIHVFRLHIHVIPWWLDHCTSLNHYLIFVKFSIPQTPLGSCSFPWSYPKSVLGAFLQHQSLPLKYKHSNQFMAGAATGLFIFIFNIIRWYWKVENWNIVSGTLQLKSHYNITQLLLYRLLLQFLLFLLLMSFYRLQAQWIFCEEKTK